MSRYKFSLNPKVKGYVEWQLEHYREDKQQLEKYKNDMIPSTTQKYSLTGGIQNGSVSNPTEDIGLRLVTDPYILTTERNVKAIDRVIAGCKEIDTKLIDVVYWKRTHTIVGAGMLVGLSKSSAYEHVNDILCRVALEMGIINL